MPEKTSGDFELQIKNQVDQNAQPSAHLDFGNNYPLKPSIDDLNRITVVPTQEARVQQVRHPDPAFGTHIREAVAIVKDWVK